MRFTSKILQAEFRLKAGAQQSEREMRDDAGAAAFPEIWHRVYIGRVQWDYIWETRTGSYSEPFFF